MCHNFVSAQRTRSGDTAPIIGLTVPEPTQNYQAVKTARARAKSGKGLAWSLHSNFRNKPPFAKHWWTMVGLRGDVLGGGSEAAEGVRSARTARGALPESPHEGTDWAIWNSRERCQAETNSWSINHHRILHEQTCCANGNSRGLGISAPAWSQQARMPTEQSGRGFRCCHRKRLLEKWFSLRTDRLICWTPGVVALAASRDTVWA